MNQVRSCRFDSRVGWAIVLGTLAAGGAGCESSNTVKPGAAVMLSFGAVDATSPLDPYAAPAYVAPDATGALVIPSRSEFIAIFDRLLDPDLLEDPATGGLPGLAAVTPPPSAGLPLDVSTIYSPGGDSMFHVFLPEGPSFTVNPGACGLPSGTAGTVQLATTHFVSHDQTTPVTPAAGVAFAIAYQVQPLAVVIGVPEPSADPAGGPNIPGMAPPDTSITLAFNALTPPGTSAMPDAVPAAPPPCTATPALASIASHIHVFAAVGAGAPAPVAAVISQNPADATQWVVAPPGTGADGTGGAWDVGTTVTITVDAGAVDVFDQPLGAETSASFTVIPASAP